MVRFRFRCESWPLRSKTRNHELRVPGWRRVTQPNESDAMKRETHSNRATEYRTINEFLLQMSSQDVRYCSWDCATETITADFGKRVRCISDWRATVQSCSAPLPNPATFRWNDEASRRVAQFDEGQLTAKGTCRLSNHPAQVPAPSTK